MKINRIHKRALAYFVFLLFVFLVGCDKLPFLSGIFPTQSTKQGPPSEAPPLIQGTLLAKVDNWVLTLEDFNRKVQGLESLPADSTTGQRIKIETFEDKKRLLEELISQQLLVQDAKLRGLDRKKEFIDAIEEIKRGQLTAEMQNLLTEDVKVESKEIEDVYNQYRESFREPAQWHIREIVVSTMDQANQVLIGALQGTDFASLATQYSKSASASKGGDLGFISQVKFPQLEAALSSLEPGQVSSVIKGPDGFYIVKLVEKKGGKEKSLSEVWDDIKGLLTIQKRLIKIQDYIVKLKQNAKIEIREDILR